MTSRKVEIAVGIFVAAGLAALVLLAMRVSNLSALQGEDGIMIFARFESIGGLKARAPVTMGGVNIGRVSEIHLDGDSYQAVVTMNIANGRKIPKDSTASIYTAGLLGEQYVGIVPGKTQEYMKNGELLVKSEPAVVMEKMLGDFFSSSNVRGFADSQAYKLTAKFTNAGNLHINSAVKLGGVIVGRVAAIELDTKRYEAVVSLSILNSVKLPLDTSASIYTASLIGGQYISLEPGGEEEYLKQGDEITLTQSALVLEELIGKFLLNTASGDSN